MQGILDKYAKFLPVEVKFGTKEESIEDGKDKEGKPKYKTKKLITSSTIRILFGPKLRLTWKMKTT